MSGSARAIKGRIGNVANIAQITRAMNTIAMTKVMRMKRRLETARPFMSEFETLVGRLLGQATAEKPHPLTEANGSNTVGILVLNADRGLCGHYKGDVNRRAEELYSEYGANAAVLAGGDKARVFFKRRGIAPLRTYANVYDTPTQEASRRIGDELIALYRKGEVGRVVCVYMRFVSDLAQRLVVQDLLPITVEPQPGDWLLEPAADEALDVVLPLYVRAVLYQAILETKTSEDAIRRQAMRNATDNAEDLIKDLTRAYNRARQQAITLEIADILGGAEALRDV
jgi:F-type H+-transporting ATPase subunit gamma